MINSRQLYHEERDRHPLMPELRTKVDTTIPEQYAVIERSIIGMELNTGNQYVTFKAVDAETGEIIATKEVRKFNITSADRVTAEGEIREIVCRKGYKIKND